MARDRVKLGYMFRVTALATVADAGGDGLAASAAADMFVDGFAVPEARPTGRGARANLRRCTGPGPPQLAAAAAAVTPTRDEEAGARRLFAPCMERAAAFLAWRGLLH
jgi:hypothetical protein